jgi:hypothetical protein
MPASGRKPVKQSGANAGSARVHVHVKQNQQAKGGVKTSAGSRRQPVRQSSPPR